MGLETAEQIGERLKLRPDTIKSWARSGIIPSIRITGKVIRFDPEEVERALLHKARTRTQ